jgi:hypothetical protein
LGNLDLVVLLSSKGSRPVGLGQGNVETTCM